MKKSRSTSITERTKVGFPLWRKKVDNSLFRHRATPIPKWVAENMGLEGVYPSKKCLKKSISTKVIILFRKNIYQGYVTTKLPDYGYRLAISEELTEELKSTFLMSHMRNIESALRKNNAGLEDEIPFWEFLDIEFDSQNREFIFTAHYKQKPIFPELFKNIGGSPVLKSIEDEVLNKNDFRIHKQDWKIRNLLDFEIGAFNVIYTLLDNENKLLYIGEAKDLIKRLKQKYPSIPNWTHFRYDVLPRRTPANIRLAIERMMIRSYASLLSNKSGVETQNISNYKLANDKIDKA